MQITELFFLDKGIKFLYIALTQIKVRVFFYAPNDRVLRPCDLVVVREYRG